MAREVAEEGETDVDEKIGAAATYHEDANRRDCRFLLGYRSLKGSLGNTYRGW
jgi:hypothetical protein